MTRIFFLKLHYFKIQIYINKSYSEKETAKIKNTRNSNDKFLVLNWTFPVISEF